MHVRELGLVLHKVPAEMSKRQEGRGQAVQSCKN